MTARMVVVAGPTAVGKTTLAVAVAEALGRAELLNADSRQVLRGLRVGTSAPSAAELRGVTCHLLGVAELGEEYSIARWLEAARPLLRDMTTRGALPIAVGGTGLWLRALADGFDLAGTPPDTAMRAERLEQASTPDGLAALVRQLLSRDPDAAAVVELHNPRRVVRALEVLDAGAGSVRARRGRHDPVDTCWIGLDTSADLHTAWVRRRVEAMFEGALQAEVEQALARGVPRPTLRAAGIGYAEALALLDGMLSAADAVTATVKRTLRYAKAQRTWFRGERRITWLDAALPLDQLRAAALQLVRAFLEREATPQLG